MYEENQTMEKINLYWKFVPHQDIHWPLIEVELFEAEVTGLVLIFYSERILLILRKQTYEISR